MASDLISRSALIEEWKDIKGYEGLYQISNLGRVRNKSNKILKPFKKGMYGHSSIGLSKNNKCKNYQIHRLVALHFIPNPDNKPEVCHKDNSFNEDGLLNNSADNLCWGTHKENCAYENTRKRQSDNHADFKGKNNPRYGKHLPNKAKEKLMKERGKQVLQWQNGRVIAFYESLKDAGRKTGITWTSIRHVCNGTYKQAGGYEWTYVCKPYNVDAVVEHLKYKADVSIQHHFSVEHNVAIRVDDAEKIRDICSNHSIGADSKNNNEPLYAHKDGTWHSLIDDVAEQLKEGSADNE